MSNQKWRIIITLLIVAVSFGAFWDTFNLWTMTDEAKVEYKQKTQVLCSLCSKKQSG